MDLKTPFRTYLWAHIPTALQNHLIIGHTLFCFREICTKLEISLIPGPLTAVQMNPEFLPGLTSSSVKDPKPSPALRTHHFYCAGSFMNYNQFTAQWPDTRLTSWTYMQMRNFLWFSECSSAVSWPLTPFESLCSRSSPQQHVISTDHNFFSLNKSPGDGKACSAWEKDLQIDLPPEELGRVHRNTHKGSINFSVQENSCKLLSRWYRTPALLHKFDSSTSKCCWRCHKDIKTPLNTLNRFQSTWSGAYLFTGAPPIPHLWQNGLLSYTKLRIWRN